MDTRIIEIGGVKLEVDLRQAKQVESYKVGDNIKVLVKEYGDSFKSYPGVIVGFDNFALRPTIIIAYLKEDYSSTKVEFLFINADSKDTEICPMIREEIVIAKATVCEQLDRAIAQKENEIADLKMKKAYFLNNFGKYFAYVTRIKED